MAAVVPVAYVIGVPWRGLGAIPRDSGISKVRGRTIVLALSVNGEHNVLPREHFNLKKGAAHTRLLYLLVSIYGNMLNQSEMSRGMASLEKGPISFRTTLHGVTDRTNQLPYNVTRCNRSNQSASVQRNTV